MMIPFKWLNRSDKLIVDLDYQSHFTINKNYWSICTCFTDDGYMTSPTKLDISRQTPLLMHITANNKLVKLLV